MPSITFNKAEEKEIEQVAGTTVKIISISIPNKDCSDFRLRFDSRKIDENKELWSNNGYVNLFGSIKNKSFIEPNSNPIVVDSDRQFFLSLSHKNNEPFEGVAIIEYEIISNPITNS